MAKDTPKSSKSGVSGPVRQHYELATTGKCDCGDVSHAKKVSTGKK